MAQSGITGFARGLRDQAAGARARRRGGSIASLWTESFARASAAPLVEYPAESISQSTDLHFGAGRWGLPFDRRHQGCGLHRIGSGNQCHDRLLSRMESRTELPRIAQVPSDTQCGATRWGSRRDQCPRDCSWGRCLARVGQSGSCRRSTHECNGIGNR